MSARWVRPIVLVIAVAAVLAVVRPWTVRPLRTAPPAAAFDANAYADRAWPRLVDEASRTAVEEATARQAAMSPTRGTGRKALFITVTGVVTRIDRRSRVGLARLRVGERSDEDVGVQIGPVIRGTALRDAASFIRFNDFANQFEYAAVSGALHERVLRDVVGRLDLDSLVGRRVTAVGGAVFPADTQAGTPIEIVPVRLIVEETKR